MLRLEADETRPEPGKCAGFAAVGSAHQLVNETAGDVMLLEFGNHGLAGLAPIRRWTWCRL